MHKSTLFPAPPYSHAPLPPQRKSSANREAFVHKRQTQTSRKDHTSKTFSADRQISQDEISQGFDAFDDDLLQPEQSTQVSKMAGLFPAPARTRYVRFQAFEKCMIEQSLMYNPSASSARAAAKSKSLNRCPASSRVHHPPKHQKEDDLARSLLRPCHQRLPASIFERQRSM